MMIRSIQCVDREEGQGINDVPAEGYWEGISVMNE